MDDDIWVDYPSPRSASATLLCIPYAGGGPAVYRHWQAALPDAELGAVRLPGRDRRLDEAPVRRLAMLIPLLADAIEPHLVRPYALFGHSIGGRIAFELARELRRRGGPAPVAFFASGSRPPHIVRSSTLHDLSDDQLCEWLVQLGGIPARLIADAEMRAVLLPALRADLELEAGEPLPVEAPLACPMRAFGGTEDHEVAAELIAQWRQHTTGAFALRHFSGGHFFLRQHYSAILADITADLLTALVPAR